MTDDWSDEDYLRVAAGLDTIFNEVQRRVQIARALKTSYLRGRSFGITLSPPKIIGRPYEPPPPSQAKGETDV